jgi:aspartate oxidase
MLQAMYKSYGTCRELMELRNLTTVGELILMSALQRKGSCGGHYCLDDPARAVRTPCIIHLITASGQSCNIGFIVRVL